MQLALALLALAVHARGIAQVALDVGGASVPIAGSANYTYEITNDLGTQEGNNLFFRFSDFSIAFGDSARFSSNVPTNHVIGGVTGANPSQINGLIKSDIAGADIWLLNPNGIVFGSGAELDVLGGFHASTADYLNLEDGQNPSGCFGDCATSANPAILTSARPAAFGFLDPVGRISITAAPTESRIGFSIPAGESFSMTGRIDKTPGSGVTGSGLQNVTINAPDGRIDLISVNSAGQIVFDPQSTNPPELLGITELGDIEAVNAVVESNGGRIFIRGNRLLLDANTTITASSTGIGNGGAIVIDASGKIELNGGQLVSSAETSGAAGSVTVTAREIEITNDGEISVDTHDGAGGAVTLNVDNLRLESGGELVASTSGSGNAGNITIRGFDGSTPATSVTVSGDDSAIESESDGKVPDNPGKAGDITVTAREITIDDNGLIEVPTIDGKGGAITLNVDKLTIQSGGELVAGTSGRGDAGNITIQGVDGTPATSVLVSGANTAIESNSLGNTPNDPGKAGDVKVSARDVTVEDDGRISVTTIDGKGGSITLANLETLLILSRGTVTANSTGIGNSGAIVIDAGGKIELNGGQLVSSAETSGAAGSVTATAREIEITNDGEISVDTHDGAGGAVTLNVDNLRLENGGELVASTSGSGNAGNITIRGFDGSTPATSVLVSGEDSAIESESVGQLVATAALVLGSAPTAAAIAPAVPGQAGNIVISAANITVTDNGLILVPTADGAGGSIQLLNVEQLAILNGGNLTASTSGLGEGGTITIEVSGDVQISSGQLISNSTGTGGAGTITLNAAGQTVLLDQGGLISVNSDGSGGAGSVHIQAADLRMIDSNIDATALQSLAGNVNLTVDGNIQLTRSVISGESASADAAGGSFSVSKPAALILEQGSLISGSSASAAGGNVTIEADAIVIDPTSNVSASGDLFTIGSVLGSTIQIEDPEAVDASSELATRCTPQQIENRSSLVINTVPPGAVRSPYLTAGPGLVNTPVANAPCGGP